MNMNAGNTRDVFPPSEWVDLWPGLLETVILCSYDVLVEGAVACSQNSMISTRFLQRGLCSERGVNCTASVTEQLIRHQHINHVTAIGFSRERHRLLKAAI